VLHNRTPAPKTLKVVIGLVIGLVVIPALVVSCVSNELSRSFGGRHTATDRTVSAARIKGKPVAEKELQRLLTVLVPVLGKPVRRALADGCQPSDGDNYLSSKISCGRSYFLYFPTTAEPPLAPVISKVVAGDAHTSPMDSPVRSGFSSSSDVPYLSGWVWIESKPAAATTYGLPIGPPLTLVEQEGCSELAEAASTGANVVVGYSLNYFTG
jgi:uncharacterized protein YbjQ (UPF0145 family)